MAACFSTQIESVRAPQRLCRTETADARYLIAAGAGFVFHRF
jgi:hypothetical protein